jgi:hypothetical protein
MDTYQRLHSIYKETVSKTTIFITGVIGTHPSSLITDLPMNEMLAVLEKTFRCPSMGQVRINTLADFINMVCGDNLATTVRHDTPTRMCSQLYVTHVQTRSSVRWQRQCFR